MQKYTESSSFLKPLLQETDYFVISNGGSTVFYSSSPSKKTKNLALNKILNLLKTESERLLPDMLSILSWIRCKS